MGTDRRLPMELESGLFRILDEALGGYLGAAPDRVSLRLDWTDERVEGRVSASRDRTSAVEAAEREAAAQASGRRASKDLPPALAAMIEDRREQAEAAAETARNAAIVALPATAWREIQQRAATVGIAAELMAGGAELRIGVDLPPTSPPDRALAMSGERGQGLVEYGLILALSAAVAIVVLVFFGGTLSAVLEAIGQAIEAAS